MAYFTNSQHRYPIIFQKAGISPSFERRIFRFSKSDFVRFLFLSIIVSRSQTAIAP